MKGGLSALCLARQKAATLQLVNTQQGSQPHRTTPVHGIALVPIRGGIDVSATSGAGRSGVTECLGIARPGCDRSISYRRSEGTHYQPEQKLWSPFHRDGAIPNDTRTKILQISPQLIIELQSVNRTRES
jgi:hypothetical protein